MSDHPDIEEESAWSMPDVLTSDLVWSTALEVADPHPGGFHRVPTVRAIAEQLNCTEDDVREVLALDPGLAARLQEFETVVNRFESDSIKEWGVVDADARSKLLGGSEPPRTLDELRRQRRDPSGPTVAK